MALKPGDKIPEFSCTDQNGLSRSKKDLKGKLAVLFFYPKDATPGCTAEACAFRDSNEIFSRYATELWGISSDNATSHKNFSERYQLTFPLICDTENILRKTFGVPAILGFLPSRVTYVIDKSGTIRHIFNNLLDGPAHVKEALRVIKEISEQT